MNSCTSVYEVPRDNFEDMTPIPVEQFVMRPKGLKKILEGPRRAIWSRLK